MLTASDLKTKHRFVPGQTTVTFQTTHPNMAGFRVPGARKRPLKRQGAWSQGLQFDHDKCVWILPKENLRTITPENGDIISDGVNDWHIDDIEAGLIESEYKCLCTKGRTNA